MNGSNPRVLLLGLLCVAQLAVPGWMLIGRERVLAVGDSYRFECAPVDPVDFFRGRYVALGFKENPITVAEGVRFFPGQRVFVRVEVGPDGFARLRDPSSAPPPDGPFVRARVRRLSGNRRLTLDLPFDRYYVEEKIAREAARAYRDAVRARGDAVPAWASVRILGGRAVLEQLYVDDVTLREYLER